MTDKNPYNIIMDCVKAETLDAFSHQTLATRYLQKGETSQDLFLRVATQYANDAEHAQRLYNYMSQLWFLPATPILTNTGVTTKSGNRMGLPISCFINETADDLDSISSLWHENIWLAKNGGGIGSYWGNVRSISENIDQRGTSSGIIPFIKVQDVMTLAISQGCVDGETSILTEQGWVKFCDLSPEHGKVVQVNEDMTWDFVKVQEYHKYLYNGVMHHYKSVTHRLDHLVTPNHKMIVERRLNNSLIWSGKLQKVESEFLNLYYKIRIHVSPSGEDCSKDKMSTLQRFLLAYHANGSTRPLVPSKDNKIKKLVYSFGLRKMDKIKILISLLDELKDDGVVYKLYINPENTHVFYVKVPASIVLDKNLDWINLATMTRSWARDFIHHSTKWCGTLKNDNIIDHTNPISKALDKHLAIACLAGYVSTMRKCKPPTDNPNAEKYKIVINLGNHTVIGRPTTKVITSTAEIPNYDGHVYCVTVPSGMFIARRNGITIITGNSLRRGSSAVYLPVDHPEIEEFLDMRRPTGGDPNRKALNIHHGVCISDKFMHAVNEGEKWQLIAPSNGQIIKEVIARDIWIKILTTRVETGEPYLFFTDNINRQLPQSYLAHNMKVKTSNLCSEITLFTGLDEDKQQNTAVCCLSSLNLEKYEDWKGNHTFIYDVMSFLDNVLSDFIKSADPIKLKNAIRSSSRERSVGLGVMGFHSYLQMNFIPIESQDAVEFNDDLFKWIRSSCDVASKRLAYERGANPLSIGNSNERFSHKLSIAPTASISIIATCASPGVDLCTSNVYQHKTSAGSHIVRNKNLVKVLKNKNENTEKIWASILANNGSVQHLKILTSYERDVFKTAIEVDQQAVVKLAAQRQEYICQSQSLNIFVPADIDKKSLHDIHFNAWKLGVKTMYYCRSQSLQRSRLDMLDAKPPEPEETCEVCQ